MRNDRTPKDVVKLVKDKWIDERFPMPSEPSKSE
jgi:hypothetical protein